MNGWQGMLDAFENILLNPLRSFLTMLGVIIGVFSVVTLVSIGEGAKKYVTDQFTGLGTNVLIVTPGGAQTSGGPPIISDTIHRLTHSDADAVAQRCRSIQSVAPVIFASTSLKVENRVRDNTHIIGTTHEFQQIRNMYAEFGSFLPENVSQVDRNVCVLGRTVVRNLFGSGENPLGRWIKVGEKNFRIIGIMEEKGWAMGFDIDSLVFLPIRAAEELFDTDELLEILCKAHSSEHLDSGKEQIREILKRRHNGYEDFTVTDQAQMVETFNNILNVLTYALAGIAAISLLVGGIGIMNILLVSVREKTREIGVRKAVGATRAAILWQFLVESLTISGVGGALGILAGCGLAMAFHAVFPKMPVLIRAWPLMVSFSFSVAVGLFFGLYPAKRAADLDPVEALRYE